MLLTHSQYRSSPHALRSISFLIDTATTKIYTLSLHDALPISDGERRIDGDDLAVVQDQIGVGGRRRSRSEEHTSELQSRQYLVCRLLLEKKKQLRLADSQV